MISISEQNQADGKLWSDSSGPSGSKLSTLTLPLLRGLNRLGRHLGQFFKENPGVAGGLDRTVGFGVFATLAAFFTHWSACEVGWAVLLGTPRAELSKGEASA